MVMSVTGRRRRRRRKTQRCECDEEAAAPAWFERRMDREGGRSRKCPNAFFYLFKLTS